MSVYRRILVMSCVAALAAFSASAGEGKPGEGGKPGTPANQKPISWDELKQRCENPRQFTEQRAPENIKIMCTDVRFQWTAAQPGEVPLTGRRKVTSGVFADKYFVNAEQKDYPLPVKSGTCHRFKEIKETFSLERPLTCSEVLGIKGTLNEFCSSLLEGGKGQGGKVEQEETGSYKDTCGNGGTQNGGKPKVEAEL